MKEESHKSNPDDSNNDFLNNTFKQLSVKDEEGGVILIKKRVRK